MNLENFKLIKDAGALVAKFDIVFKPLTVKGFRIFVKSDGSRWISEPSSKFQTAKGESKFQKHVVITDEAIKAEVERLAKIEYDKAIYGEEPPAAGDDEAPF